MTNLAAAEAPPKAAAESDVDRTLVLTRRFAASREAVFRAWIDPAQFARWIGPGSLTTDVTTMDPRPGGAYRMVMHRPDGGTHIGQGIYREVLPPQRLAFTWAWQDATGKRGHETLVTIILRAVGDATELTLCQEIFESKDACERHEHGWTGSFDKLEEVLAGKR